MHPADAAVVEHLAARRRAASGALLFGLSGPQGAGKSTLARKLCGGLTERGLRAVTVSLDDFYRTRAEREQLADEVHPLLATRGVPGTHDVALARDTLARLRTLPPGATLAVPRFDKASDDRAPAAWPQVTGPLDVVIFEGWCLGLPPQSAEALVTPVNALEAEDDADGRWRACVNEQLAGSYLQLFAEIEVLMYLAVPGWECIFRWRRQQERETAAAAGRAATALTDDAALRRFLAHYERLTRHGLTVLPPRADILRRIGPEHEILDQRGA